MDYIKNTYAIDPKNFKIDFKLNVWVQRQQKWEPYYIGSETFFKTGFTAMITFQDAEGNALADLTGKPLNINSSVKFFLL